MRWAKTILWAVGATAAWLVSSGFALAYCAMCRTSLVSSLEGHRLASGLNSGVLFLLGAPFVVVGAVVLLLFKAYWVALFRRLSERALSKTG